MTSDESDRYFPTDQGTRWTELGQGATAIELYVAIGKRFPINGNEGAPSAPLDHLFSFQGNHRTNLALTGAPLTAEDLKRIEECK
jgi:hypothetical protein